METLVRIKLLVIGCLFSLSFKAIAQARVVLKVDSCQVLYYGDGIFRIPIAITNNEDTGILVPADPKIYGKLGMSRWEIGMELFYEDTGKDVMFEMSLHYLAEPKMVWIKPKESMVITDTIPIDFFSKKRAFDAILYLMLPIIRQKDKYLYCPSNKFKIVPPPF